jgi:RimJ/RimL family protein N-acetyltransferase
MTSLVLSTDRLDLRLFSYEDAPFFFELLNDPDWLQFIGDRGVRTLDDARGYIERGLAMYQRLGFGLWLVERREDRAALGICGLIKRDSLQDVDIGFAFLPQFRRQGYAREAALATLAYGKNTVLLRRMVAITSPDNEPSAGVLRAIGMTLQERTRLPGETRDSLVFAWVAP